MSENTEPEGIEIPEHMAIANGHVYMVHVDVARQTPSDREIATLLAPLGVVRVQHAAVGGVNVAIEKTINEKENA